MAVSISFQIALSSRGLEPFLASSHLLSGHLAAVRKLSGIGAVPDCLLTFPVALCREFRTVYWRNHLGNLGQAGEQDCQAFLVILPHLPANEFTLLETKIARLLAILPPPPGPRLPHLLAD